MSKQSLLLVDGDPRSLRVLEVSLKKAGFNVTTAINGRDALDKVELGPPDLVISETQLEEIDGFAFCQRLKGNPAWADIPFVFLTAQTDIATKIRGLELGVDDYLTKPIYIKEIVARARILLQKRQRTRIEERRDGRTRFAGHLSDMPIVDLIQTVEISRKSGLIQFIGDGGKQAAIYFRDGKVIDAEAGPLLAEDAVYRLLTWNEGEFEVAFRTVRRRDTITMSPQALLMEGMRRLDEWGRLCEQLPPLETRFEIDARELANRLGDIQDEHNAILRLFDGRRSVLEVIDACDYGDLESLEVIARLYFEGVLVEAGPAKPTMSSEWMVPAAAIEAATAAVHAPLTGLVSEDGDELHGAEERTDAATSGSRTISGEWTLEPDEESAAPGPAPAAPGVAAAPEAPVRAVPPLPTLPRTLTPSSRPGAVPAVPALPTVGGPRRSLIQKAIDDSDAIPVKELEEQLGRELIEGPAVVLSKAATADVEKAATTRSPDSAAVTTMGKPAEKPAEKVAEKPAEKVAEKVADKVAEKPAERVAEKSTVATADKVAAVAQGEQAAEKAATTVTLADKAPARTSSVTGPEKAATAAKTTVTLADRAPVAGTPGEKAAASVEKAAAVATTGDKATASAEKAVVAVAVAEKSAAAPAGPRGPGATDAPGRPARPTAKPPGSATLVTDPPAPARAPVGSQRVPIERAQPRRNGASASSTEIIPPNRRGPRWPAIVIGLVIVVGVIYAVVRVRGSKRQQPVAAFGLDAGATSLADGGGSPSLAIDASAGPVDADVPVDSPRPPVDARARVDAGRTAVDAGPAPVDDEFQRRLDAARKLMASDPQAALDLIDVMLDEKRSGRALILRADALQRLGRTDAALSAIGAAIAMAPRSSGAWELKGRILWNAGRREEARPAYVRYLELQPTGAVAEDVRRRLSGS